MYYEQTYSYDITCLLSSRYDKGLMSKHYQAYDYLEFSFVNSEALQK